MIDVSLRKRISGLIGIIVVLMAISATIAAAVPFQKGDVFAGVGNGQIRHYDKNGIFIENLTVPGVLGQEDTGMAFDSSGNLYATVFGANKIAKFNNTGVFLSLFGSGYNAHPESIVIDATGNFFVGQADGTRQILKFDSAGNLLANFTPARDQRGTDWIDLASDQCTIYYTSEGKLIKRFNVCTNTQLADFASGLHGAAFALRILPKGEVLVADSQDVHRLNDSGNIVQTYPKPMGETSNLFALNLDPDGTSFWTAGFSSGKAYKIDIATGNLLLTINTTDKGRIITLAGLTVFGEQTAAKPELGSISGMKFNDSNGNGAKDPGELGLADWTIQLKNQTGSMTAITDINGNYTFSELAAGNYVVEEVLKAGWTQTFPPGEKYTVNVADGQNVIGRDFGNKLNVTVTPGAPKRPTEIIDNMTGIPVVNESTVNKLAEDFMNFALADPYTITITRVSDGVVEFSESGTLLGSPKQTIAIDWIPKAKGDYILRSEANTIAETRTVLVINQKVISPVPELSTLILLSAGLFGLFGLSRRQRKD